MADRERQRTQLALEWDAIHPVFREFDAIDDVGDPFNRSGRLFGAGDLFFGRHSTPEQNRGARASYRDRYGVEARCDRETVSDSALEFGWIFRRQPLGLIAEECSFFKDHAALLLSWRGKRQRREFVRRMAAGRCALASGPAHERGQGGEDRLDVAAGLESEDRATVV